MKLLKIGENDANQRLDKFLKKLLPNATKSLIYKLNRTNKIKIKKDPFFKKDDGLTLALEKEKKFKKRDNDYKLKIGDEVKIFLIDEEFKELTKSKKTPSSKNKKTKFSKKNIIFEDSDLLVINKDPGINVHPGDHKTKETNIIDQIQDYLGDLYDSLTFKPSLIHRIDRDTSGILMIAKKKDILTKLVNDFKTKNLQDQADDDQTDDCEENNNKIKKTYYAIVLGKLSRKKGNIKKKLIRVEGAKNENKVQISENGQTALTQYKLIEEYFIKIPQGTTVVSEVQIQIETGRTHQIRVHMASMGNPILGDKTYGDKKLNSYLEKHLGLTRQALHASEIEFFHHGKKQKMELKAELKKDLTDFIGKIHSFS